MKKILYIQLIVSTLGTLLTHLASLDVYRSLSFALGSGIVLMNLLSLSWIWGAIIRKKLVALAILGIVIKYALLVGILVALVKTLIFQPLWVIAGLSTLILTAVIYTKIDLLVRSKISIEGLD